MLKSTTPVLLINGLKIVATTSLRLPLSGTESRKDKLVRTSLHSIPAYAGMTEIIRGTMVFVPIIMRRLIIPDT